MTNWKVNIKDLYPPYEKRTVIVEAPTRVAARQSVELGESEIITFVHVAGHCPYDGRACDSESIPHCKCCIADYYQKVGIRP